MLNAVYSHAPTFCFVNIRYLESYFIELTISMGEKVI